MARHAFTKADAGFFQAYQISLARRNRARSRRAGAAAPAGGADDDPERLWLRLEAGAELARQRVLAEHADLRAGLESVLDLDAANWAGHERDAAEAAQLHSGMLRLVAGLGEGSNKRVAEVRPGPPGSGPPAARIAGRRLCVDEPGPRPV